MEYGVVRITQANLDHSHLYLADVFDMFPIDAIGGSSIVDRAPRLLEIHCGIEGKIITDIAGDKKIFRKRGWVREFFAVHDIQAGSAVVIENTGGDRYHIYPIRLT